MRALALYAALQLDWRALRSDDRGARPRYCARELLIPIVKGWSTE